MLHEDLLFFNCNNQWYAAIIETGIKLKIRVYIKWILNSLIKLS